MRPAATFLHGNKLTLSRRPRDRGLDVGRVGMLAVPMGSQLGGGEEAPLADWTGQRVLRGRSDAPRVAVDAVRGERLLRAEDPAAVGTDGLDLVVFNERHPLR